ncbi:OsmC family protein [Pelomonas sp. Root1237]|uniref:OsmC family protein n=1 Tax=Pelomonas sp. Root1237 TaxID=1736434 RepID=UPI0006FB0740|nr:OsmC family protein [Pelomonas sp. Root1237]KQV88406.1 osmotically inducible protein OsmC [Pelomonas sp. Root1237]
MQISARLRNTTTSHAVQVNTAGQAKPLATEGRAGGGSAVNGGEFLMLALASCYCNDLYREAVRLQIELTEVEVEASAEFDGIGLAARDIQYRARLVSPASPEQIEQLLAETDAVAEVHNTLRASSMVRRLPWPDET